MKTKLLRKVRKRYSIDYWPNGARLFDTSYGECLQLVDHDRSYLRTITLTVGEYTKEEIYNILYKRLMQWIREDYRSEGIRRKAKQLKQKLWWNAPATTKLQNR